ncbi:MAG: NAD(P)H-hydrate epimerase [Candidatus Limnocylindrales bacterium]
MIDTLPLPSADPFLDAPGPDLDALAAHWAPVAARAAISGEEMQGIDARAQRLGMPGETLMEEAGRAVAAVALAMLGGGDERRPGLVLVLAGPGNNGGDGHVAARHLAAAGVRSVVALASTDARPGTRDAATNWDRLDGIAEVERLHLANAHDARVLLNGIERAALVIDALLGTGVRGSLREPIWSAVEVCLRARWAGVPILAVDTPTAVDPTSGAPSDPVVRAHVTVTFHRPRTGLATRTGAGLAGRVLVAPIGIPPLADRS